MTRSSPEGMPVAQGNGNVGIGRPKATTPCAMCHTPLVAAETIMLIQAATPGFQADQLGQALNRTPVICGVCSTPHHLDCWKASSKCSVFGCQSRAFMRVPVLEELVQNHAEDLRRHEEQRQRDLQEHVDLTLRLPGTSDRGEKFVACLSYFFCAVVVWKGILLLFGSEASAWAALYAACFFFGGIHKVFFEKSGDRFFRLYPKRKIPLLEYHEPNRPVRMFDLAREHQELVNYNKVTRLVRTQVGVEVSFDGRRLQGRLVLGREPPILIYDIIGFPRSDLTLDHVVERLHHLSILLDAPIELQGNSELEETMTNVATKLAGQPVQPQIEKGCGGKSGAVDRDFGGGSL